MNCTRYELRHRPTATAVTLLVLVLASACSREAPAPPPASAAGASAGPAPPPARNFMSPTKRAEPSSSSTRLPARCSSESPSANGRGGFAPRTTGPHCSSRSRDRRLPARASTSRSCPRPIARPTASASSISRTRKLVRTLQSGQDPEAFDLSPDGKTLYVSNEETAEMSVLDVRSGTIRDAGQDRRGARRRDGAARRPRGLRHVRGDNEVFAVDTKTLKVVGRMKTAARPRSIVFTNDGATAFVTDENAATVTRHRHREARSRQVNRPARRQGPDGAAADGSRPVTPMGSRCISRSAAPAPLPSSTWPKRS